MNPVLFQLAACIERARIIRDCRKTGSFQAAYHRAHADLLRACALPYPSPSKYLPDGTHTILDYYAVDMWVAHVSVLDR